MTAPRAANSRIPAPLRAARDVASALAQLGGDPDRLRAVAEQLIRLGGDPAIVGAAIARRLDTRPDARRQRRDAAIADLCATFDRRDPDILDRVAEALRRYGAAAWQRRDHRLPTLPDEYAGNPRARALFTAMHAHGGAFTLGAKQLARILKTSAPCHIEQIAGHGGAVAMSAAASQPPPRKSKPPRRQRNPALNAVSPDSEFLEALKRAPIGKAALAESAARTVAARREIVAALSALDKKADVDFPGLEKALQAEIAARAEIEKALRAANERVRLAALIDGFQAEMRDELELAIKRHEGGYVYERQPLARDPRDRVRMHGFSNSKSVNARREAIYAAIAAAEALRLAPDQAHVAGELAALRGALPEIVPAVMPTIPGPGEAAA